MTAAADFATSASTLRRCTLTGTPPIGLSEDAGIELELVVLSDFEFDVAQEGEREPALN